MVPESQYPRRRVIPLWHYLVQFIIWAILSVLLVLNGIWSWNIQKELRAPHPDIQSVQKQLGVAQEQLVNTEKRLVDTEKLVQAGQAEILAAKKLLQAEQDTVQKCSSLCAALQLDVHNLDKQTKEWMIEEKKGRLDFISACNWDLKEMQELIKSDRAAWEVRIKEIYSREEHDEKAFQSHLDDIDVSGKLWLKRFSDVESELGRLNKK